MIEVAADDKDGAGVAAAAMMMLPGGLEKAERKEDAGDRTAGVAGSPGENGRLTLPSGSERRERPREGDIVRGIGPGSAEARL